MKCLQKPPRMMLRHLQGKPNTWNPQNPFSSTRTNPPSMDGVPLLLETLTGVPSLSLYPCNRCSILLQLSRYRTRMVWEHISSLRPSLGQARWNLSPSNRPLGFVKSKPSKPPMMGSLAKSQISKDNHT
jgi:hypothetical protein